MDGDENFAMDISTPGRSDGNKSAERRTLRKLMEEEDWGKTAA